MINLNRWIYIKFKIIYETQKQHTNLYFLQWQAANLKKEKRKGTEKKNSYQKGTQLYTS